MTGLPRAARGTFATVLGMLAIAAAVAPPRVWSQNQGQLLPPLIRACLAEADSGQRLDCYDREVARLLMPPDHSTPGQAATTLPVPPVLRGCIADADAGRRRDCYDREVARMIMPPERPGAAPLARAPADAAPVSPPVAPPAPPPAPVAAAPTHLSAHVTRLESGGDRLVVHLDNGQAWEQSQAGSLDLALRNGDLVKVDRQLGSWWLTDRYGETLQVRLVK